MAASLCLTLALMAPPELRGSVDSVCRVLGSRLNRRIIVQPELRNVQVYLRAKEDSPSRQIQLLETCLGASLDKSKSPWSLRRSGEEQKKILAAEQKWKEESLAAELQKLGPLGQPGRYEEGIGSSLADGVDPDLPASGMLDSLLLGMGPKQLAELPLYRVEIWATNPRPAEKALPLWAESLCRQYSSALLAAERALAARGSSLLDRWSVSQAVGAFQKGPASRLVLSLYRTDTALFAGAAAYSSGGLMRGHSVRRLAMDLPASKPLQAEGAVSFTEEAQTLRTAILSRRSSPEILNLTGDKGLDPLDLGLTPALRNLAAEEDLEAAVALPDAAALAGLRSGGSSVPDILRGAAQAGLALTREDGVLTGRLAAPWTLERACLDRAEWRKSLARASLGGLDALRAHCVLAASQGDAVSFSRLDDWLREDLAPLASGRPPVPIHLHRSLCQALGSLSEEEWQALLSGRAAQASSLAFRQALNQWTWSSFSLLRHPSGPVPDEACLATAALPAGISADAILCCQSSPKASFRHPAFGPEWLDIEDLASLLAVRGVKPAEDEIAARLGRRLESSMEDGLVFVLNAGQFQASAFQPLGERRSVQQGISFSELPLADQQALIHHAEAAAAVLSGGQSRAAP